MNQARTLVTGMLMLLLGLGGCSTAPTSEASREELLTSAAQALAEMRNADPTLAGFLERGYGYAMFPSVGAGGLVIGGGWGRAVVFEQGKHVGFADMTQANVGLTAGGQRFRQLIVFQDRNSLERFKANQLTLDANFSGVVLTTGAAASANFQNGVAVFVQPIGGLMAAANVGGQQFRYQPLP